MHLLVGITTLVGTAPNLSFVRIFEILYPDYVEISFSKWLIFAFPIALVMFTTALFLIYLLFLPKSEQNNLSKDFFKKAYIDFGSHQYGTKEGTGAICYPGIIVAL